MSVVEMPFKADWPEPDPRYLRDELPPPPALPLYDVFSPKWARWMEEAAESKASPVDYVMAAVLSACGSLAGNSRWVHPWSGWAEPPILWSVVIGNPSANKSPGLDAVLVPLRTVERALRTAALEDMAEWRERSEIAKLADSAWKESVKAALKSGDEEPSRPSGADAGPAPNIPRLAVSDTTVEKLAVIVSGQPRGTLVYRDELSGWLMGMTRYSGGSSDRPFWLEAYGGRGYTVERMGRDPVYIERLSVGVVGGIQPDLLRSLLMKADDDGLLARFLPIWPKPAAIRRPSVVFDQTFVEDACTRLLGMEMDISPSGERMPRFIPFSPDARNLLDEFREQVREWEAGTDGLLLSFNGKLPGIATRLSLILALLDYASGEANEPDEVTSRHFGRAAHFIEAYLRPMAQRAYLGSSRSEKATTARKLIALIRERSWSQFTAREVMRFERVGLSNAEDIDPGLRELEEADIIKPAAMPASGRGGRPKRLFLVNPFIHGRGA